MPISPVGGSGKQSFGPEGIKGDGSQFKLGSIKQQFEALNKKFDAIKAGGQHDPSKLKAEAEAWEKSKKGEIPDDIKLKLEQMKKEILDMEKDQASKKIKKPRKEL